MQNIRKFIFPSSSIMVEEVKERDQKVSAQLTCWRIRNAIASIKPGMLCNHNTSWHYASDAMRFAPMNAGGDLTVGSGDNAGLEHDLELGIINN